MFALLVLMLDGHEQISYTCGAAWTNETGDIKLSTCWLLLLAVHTYIAAWGFGEPYCWMAGTKMKLTFFLFVLDSIKADTMRSLSFRLQVFNH